MLLTFLALIPDMSCHWENVGYFPFDGLTVSKKLPNRMWNYGETNPVCRIRIKVTDDAVLDEGSRLIPCLVLAFNLVFSPPA